MGTHSAGWSVLRAGWACRGPWEGSATTDPATPRSGRDRRANTPQLHLPQHTWLKMRTLWPSARSLGSSLLSSTILPEACAGVEAGGGLVRMVGGQRQVGVQSLNSWRVSVWKSTGHPHLHQQAQHWVGPANPAQEIKLPHSDRGRPPSLAPPPAPAGPARRWCALPPPCAPRCPLPNRCTGTKKKGEVGAGGRLEGM